MRKKMPKSDLDSSFCLLIYMLLAPRSSRAREKYMDTAVQKQEPTGGAWPVRPTTLLQVTQRSST